MREASKSQRRSPPRRIGFWIGVAVLVHAELLFLLAVGLYLFAPRNADLAGELGGQKQGESIDVGMVDEDAAREIIADLEKQDEQRKAEQVKKEEEQIHPPGQVVELPTPREEKRPDSARFVSEHDSTVNHETKKLGPFQDHAQQASSGDATVAEPRQPATAPGDGRLALRAPDLDRAARSPGAAGPAARAGRPGSAAGIPDIDQRGPDGTIPELGAEGRPSPTGGGAQGGLGPELTPTEQQLARALGSGTQDALQDVDDGEDTALNSKKWRFASFFNRVKIQVAKHWHPEETYRRRDPTGEVYGRRNRYTELRIQLKPDGRLSNVALAAPSGLDFLDDEAIEAFKQAEPFPNPPRQLIEQNGLINFGFGFFFDLNGAPQMRWFKY